MLDPNTSYANRQLNNFYANKQFSKLGFLWKKQEQSWSVDILLKKDLGANHGQEEI